MSLDSATRYFLQPWFRVISSPLFPQPDDNIDTDDLVTLWWGRRGADKHIGRWNIYEFVLVFDEKVIVKGGVGIKIGFGRVDRDLTQEASVGELVQCVIDGCERNANLCACRFLVEHFSSYMPIALGEQNFH